MQATEQGFVPRDLFDQMREFEEATLPPHRQNPSWGESEAAQEYSVMHNLFQEVDEMMEKQFPGHFDPSQGTQAHFFQSYRDEEVGFVEIVKEVSPQMAAMIRAPVMDEELDDEKQEVFDKFKSLTMDIDYKTWWTDVPSKLRFRKKFQTADQKIKQLEEQGKNDFQKLTILQDDLDSGRITNPLERRIYNQAIKLIKARYEDLNAKKFNNEERIRALKLYRQLGPKWDKIAQIMNKSQKAVKLEIGKAKFLFGQDY